MTLVKSASWNVHQALVTPKWQGFWDGLVGNYPMTEGGGSTVRNVAGPRNLAGTLGSNASWENSPHGRVVGFNRTAAGDIDLGGNFGFGALTGSPFTFATAFLVRSMPVSNATIWGRLEAGTGDLLRLLVSGAAEPDRLTFTYGTGPYDAVIINEVIFYRVWYVAVQTFSTVGVGTLYFGELGGPILGTATDTSPQGAYDSPTEIHLGNRGGDDAEPSDSQVATFLVWNRDLNRAQAAAIIADPFGINRPDFRVIGKRAGRIMSSLAGSGGLAAKGGIAGIGGGLAA